MKKGAMKRKVILIRKIVRHADAGYEEAIEFARENDVKVPMVKVRCKTVMDTIEIDSEEKCYFSHKISEEKKEMFRGAVCKDLPIKFEKNGKYYCVLHYPDYSKHRDTNFVEIIAERLKAQENNFYCVYFPDKTDYFSNHQFTNVVNFQYAYFRDAVFKKAIFDEWAGFSLSTLEKANFQEAEFRNRSFFVGTTFAVERYQQDEHIVIDFSKAKFADAIFQDCVFFKHPHFNDLEFKEASFLRSKFKKGASFFSTKFNGRVGFDEAIFDGHAEFNNVVFDCDEDAKQSAKNKSFIITSSFSRTQFEDVVFTKTTFEAVNFKETIFEKVQFWESTFNSLADFESATFKSIDFYKVKFLNEAHFKKAKFQGRGGFFWSEFTDKMQFNEANFENTCDILFNFTGFQQFIDFESANVSGYLSFNGSNDEKVFFDETDLNLEFIRIENPEKVSFHTVELHPYWFINVDSRKFTFANVNWGEAFGKTDYQTNELKRITNRGNNNSEQIFKITCRQLAENAENNNRFEEASNFRRMAFETEWLEKKEKISNWFKNLIPESEKLKRRFSGSKDEEDKPNPPTNSFGILRRSGDFIIHGFYRITSFYGESWERAFIWFVLICPVFALLLYLFGSFEKNSLQTAGDFLAYSLQVMTLQRPEPKPVGFWTVLIYTLEIIFTPIQLALLALAIRRKFMR